MLPRPTYEEYIQRANELHHFRFNYTLLPNPLSSSFKVDIICPIHGIFNQLFQSHLQGNGCSKCSKEQTKANTQRKLILRAQTVHNNKYDYSLVNYTGKENKVIVVCPKHGSFKIGLWSHA